MADEDKTRLIELTADLVAAYASNNVVAVSDLPRLISSTHGALAALGTSRAPDISASPPKFVPAVSVRKSLASREHIVSMIDGKPYRSLRRHLTAHGLTPEGYRERYNLPASYPIVAPGYSEVRSAMARALGFGKKAAPRGRTGR